MKNGKIMGILGVLCVLGVMGIGIVGADSQTVTASYTATYTPATCALSVANSGVPGVTATAIDLSSGTGSLYVENTGVSDSLGNPSSMAVYVGFQDNGNAVTPVYGGWYFNGVFVDGITTAWTASGIGGAAGPWALQGITGNSESAAYSALTNPEGYQPVAFSVAAVSTLPADTYSQQIVVTGSC